MLGKVSAMKSGAMVAGAVPANRMAKHIAHQLESIELGTGDWVVDKWNNARWQPTMTTADHATLIERKRRGEKARIDNAVMYSGIPAVYAMANLATNANGLPMVIDDGNRKAMGFAARYCSEWAPGRKGMILSSFGNGTGKTYIMSAIGISILTRGKSFRFVTVNELLKAIQSAFNTKPEEGRTTEQIFQEYAVCDALCLDEIGGEQVKPGDAGEWARSQILSLIDDRIKNSRIIFGTTNLLPETIATRYEGRITSRLRECAAWVPLKGPDRRENVVDPFD